MNIDNLDDFDPNLTPKDLRALAKRFRGSLTIIEVEIWKCRNSEKALSKKFAEHAINQDEYYRKLYDIREKIGVFEYSSRKYSDSLRFVYELAEEMGVNIDEPLFFYYFRMFLYYTTPVTPLSPSTMNAVQLKQHFNNIKRLQEELKEECARVEKIVEELKTFPHMTKDDLDRIEQASRNCEHQLKECKKNLVNMYKLAIIKDVDLDNTRLLKVFQFFIRNALQITYWLRCINLPRGSTSIWVIVLATAFIYLWAIL
ncbi:hypothetical protein CAEBREN_25108 [Caenorhabditis brenneri]|uniref:Uncharacterized protein n=1 Tax=Caenorhabditis brenneri TaxID=135651 RepID=G0MNC3_CAEBE|nr:hypothetical protein CAEBREN_25108 [Caenorhabditis brenneri]